MKSFLVYKIRRLVSLTELTDIKPGAAYAVGKESHWKALWDVQHWPFIPPHSREGFTLACPPLGTRGVGEVGQTSDPLPFLWRHQLDLKKLTMKIFAKSHPKRELFGKGTEKIRIRCFQEGCKEPNRHWCTLQQPNPKTISNTDLEDLKHMPEETHHGLLKRRL